MVNYSNAKIYKIIDNTNGNVYIGSTVKTLSLRIGQHRTDYKRYLEGKRRFITSFKILENGNYDIILVEEFKNCENIDQLRARERFYIDSFDCVNKHKPNRTVKEWCEDNKEMLSEKKKVYRTNNKEILAAKKKEYYNINKEILAAKKKEYYNINKDKILEKSKNNILAKVKIHCEICDCMIRKSDFRKHETSKKHQENLLNKI